MNLIDPKGEGEGKVISSLIIPDLTALLEAEMLMFDTIQGYNILKTQPPLSKCFYPKYILNEKDFILQKRKINFEIDAALSNQMKGSHTALIVLDSLSSVLKIKAAARYNSIISSNLLQKLTVKIKKEAENFIRSEDDIIGDSENISPEK